MSKLNRILSGRIPHIILSVLVVFLFVVLV